MYRIGIINHMSNSREKEFEKTKNAWRNESPCIFLVCY